MIVRIFGTLITLAATSGYKSACTCLLRQECHPWINIKHVKYHTIKDNYPFNHDISNLYDDPSIDSMAYMAY